MMTTNEENNMSLMELMELSDDDYSSQEGGGGGVNNYCRRRRRRSRAVPVLTIPQEWLDPSLDSRLPTDAEFGRWIRKEQKQQVLLKQQQRGRLSSENSSTGSGSGSEDWVRMIHGALITGIAHVADSVVAANNINHHQMKLNEEKDYFLFEDNDKVTLELSRSRH